MPTYDYQCDACGHTFEAMQSMKDDPLSVCPECDRPELRRLITGGTGIIFRGSGFYVNDSRGSGKRGQTKTASDSTTSDSSSAGSGSTGSGSGSGTGASDSGKSTSSDSSSAKSA